MTDDNGKRGDRHYDTITFLLAGVLGVIVLGAIGYGVFNSSRVTAAIPTPAPTVSQPGPPLQPASPVSTSDAR